jgi:hypothetical protein
MPTVQSTADANVSLRPTAKGAQSRDEVAVASEPAGRNQSESSAPSSESLFREFQAWAAEKDAPAQVESVQQPVQNAAAKAAGMPEHHFGSRKSTGTFGPSIMHGQRCDPC